MKQLLFSISLLLCLTKGYSFSSHDSIELGNIRRPDTTRVFSELPDSNPQLRHYCVTENQSLQGVYQPFEINEGKTILAKTKFWQRVGDLFQNLYDIVTFQKSFGDFEIDGQTEQGPFTLFDRTKDAPTIQQQLSDIQTWILSDAQAREIYIEIWDQATTGNRRTAGCEGTGVCEAAQTAKCAAFVYIIGLKVTGSGLGAVVQRMGTYPSDIGQAERDVYYEIAMDVLEDLQNPYFDGFVDNEILNTLTLGVVTQIAASTLNLFQWDKMQFRAGCIKRK